VHRVADHEPQQLDLPDIHLVIETYMPTAYLRQWLLALLAVRYGTEAPVVALAV
jgi:hypothetical protein